MPILPNLRKFKSLEELFLLDPVVHQTGMVPWSLITNFQTKREGMWIYCITEKQAAG